MPYKSKAQIRFMHAVHPDIAARWDKTYTHSNNLPEHKGHPLTQNPHYKATKEILKSAKKK